MNKTIVLGDSVSPLADYMITMLTKPGDAAFEATVRHDPNADTYTVLGISRISLYGNTSWCIPSQRLKLFCYCKDQKTS
ncbi:hypothetical protein CEXT_262361 [Caerostris extrusa]|nr:hypothetical protein CEXT_262361 [Caerostris extrusa]